MATVFVCAAETSLPNHSANIAQVLLYLFVVIVLIFVIVWLLKKIQYTQHGSHQYMKVKSCLPLSSKEKLLLVEIGEQQVVIGVAPGFVGHILSLNESLELEETSVFQEKVNHFLSGEGKSKK